MLTNFPEFIRRDSVLNLQYNYLVIICGLSRVKYSPTDRTSGQSTAIGRVRFHSVL